MIVLALETSALAGSVALFDGDRLLAARELDPARRSAQTFAPAIAELLATAGIVPRDVKLVATTVGPGSFTGLRVGVTAAKTFAYAVGAEVLGLNTLEVIAAQTPLELLENDAAEVQAVIDAQRKELYVGRFSGREFAPLAANAIVPEQAWLDALLPGTIVTGPGLARLESRLPAGVVAVERPFRQPQAFTVGKLAWRDYRRGRRDDLWKLAPAYLRASAAEEKAAKSAAPP